MGDVTVTMTNGFPTEINQAGIDLIKSFEGLRTSAYYDAVGVRTIGYGHAIRPGENLTVITEAQAEELLRQDLREAEEAVDRYVHVSLNANQFSALVSFAYNVGAGNFAKSMVLRFLSERRYQAAADDLLRWNRAGGRVLEGLVRRRAAERRLFMTP